jgi:hypothetical protein
MDFSSKAGTLKALSGVIKNARIPKIFTFTFQDWKENSHKLVSTLTEVLGPSPWIVRSSAKNEDLYDQSNAGAMLSIQNVDSNNISQSIVDVFNSYSDLVGSSEILVQPMVRNVIRSGVAFSHEPNSGSPYRIVNWAESNDTTLITSGHSMGRVWQQSPRFNWKKPVEIKPVVNLLEELLQEFNGTPLDLEFAISKEAEFEVLWLLQVRPLIVKGNIEDEDSLIQRLNEISAKIKNSLKENPFLVGKTTVFGIMPDWNPAEIVGVKPKPLALSLYRELITDSIWAYQRNNYGYRNLRSFPLMSHFYGLPYIDVRVSFNSFIPAEIDDAVADKLSSYYINKLIKEPTLHDKVEFEIVLSSFTFDLDNKLKNLSNFDFDKDEIAQIRTSLVKLTNSIINPLTGLWKLDSAKLSILKIRRSRIENSNLNDLEKIYWYIEDAKRYGTLPFAGLARAAFIAVQILKSLVTTNIFSQDDYEKFIGSISTISKDLIRDKQFVPKEDFLLKYGHLRPGTYDILSKSYDEDPNFYYNDESINFEESEEFTITPSQESMITSMLESARLSISCSDLFAFIKEAIRLREYAKFEFTKNLSLALKLINNYGKNLGVQRSDLAFADYNVFKELYFSTDSQIDSLLHNINIGKERYQKTLKTFLPPLIISPEDVFGFEWPTTLPNFVTQKQITSNVEIDFENCSIENKIICIPNADPGYDWLFSHKISGLITAWGGANSHMAIRAGELGIPAVIGAGELLYKLWSKSKILHIDCANRKVEIVL